MPKLTANEQRNIYQEEAVKLYIKHRWLALAWATGVGKTRGALLCIDHSLKEDPSRKWFIVCKELTHIQNWKDDIDKHNFNHLLPHIEFFCYASLSKYHTEDIYGVVLDECHGATSSKRLEYLSILNKNTDKIIALSASISDEHKLKFKKTKLKFHYFEIDLIDAINSGILPQPEIYIHRIHLQAKQRNQVYTKEKGGKLVKKKKLSATFDDYKKILAKARRDKIKAHTLSIACNEYEKYLLYSYDISYYQSMFYRTKNEFFKYKMLALASARKRFLSEAKSNILTSIVKKLSKKSTRRIIFTGSKNQAELISNNYIHSDLTRKEVQERITSFNSKDIDELSCVKMARESLNLTDIEAVVITQLDSIELYFIQMLGRSLRGISPQAHLIIVQNTQDEKYLNNVLSKSRINKSWIHEIKH